MGEPPAPYVEFLKDLNPIGHVWPNREAHLILNVFQKVRKRGPRPNAQSLLLLSLYQRHLG